MKHKFNCSLLILVMIFSACSSSKQLAEVSDALQEEYDNGSYGNALAEAEKIISDLEDRGRSVPGPFYSIAGLSAYQTGNTQKSIRFLDKSIASKAATAEVYFTQARNYRQIDNLSKEISILEIAIDKYPDHQSSAMARERLFQTCRESEDFELAQELWDQLDLAARQKVVNLDVYLFINTQLENDDLVDSLAREILQLNPEHIPSLERLGKHYFWKAENSYQAEMKAYEANRTRKQYRQLLKAFKVVTEDFKASLDYFKRLYDIDAQPEYARYLSNIYMRLDDEEKADYYKSKSN